MTPGFEEHKRINDIISKSQLANTAADMVKKQVEASSIQSETAKYAESVLAALKPKLGYDVSAAINENLSISNQLKNEIDKHTKYTTAGIQQYVEEEKMIEKLKSQLNSIAGMESTKSMLHDYESATKAIDMNTICAYADASNKDTFNEQKIEIPSFQLPNFHHQKNPIHETNKRLERLEIIATVKNEKLNLINRTAEDLTKNHFLNSIESKKSSNWMQVATVIGLIVGALGVYLTYIGIQDNRAINLKAVDEKTANTSNKK